MAYLHFFVESINRNLQPNLDATELIIAINLSYSPESKVFDILLVFVYVTMKSHLYGFNKMSQLSIQC